VQIKEIASLLSQFPKTGNASSSPKAFIRDPMFLKKRLDSRSEALR